MTSFIINVDAGEGSPGSQVDLELLENVDAVNIALGAHAGNPTWSRELAARAVASGKRVHLHPGYPDREGFGRRSMQISWSELSDSLSVQRDVLPDVATCKFHGAIYHQAGNDRAMADQLTQWCIDHNISEILTPDASELALSAKSRGINVLREAFVDRRYRLADGRLQLQPRSEPGAIIDDVESAIAQAERIILQQEVELVDHSVHPISCDTLCLHGDALHAVELSKALRDWRCEK
ncbi:MAG: hypothetical protein HKN47_13170 [Pirellulaceae bacterium]|nr:hypothetical protein [Pirellulaceae bacterium]